MTNVGAATDGVDILSDGEDLIDLSALEGLASFEQLNIETYGSTAVIELPCCGGELIRLQGIDADDLDATDFVFYEPPAEGAPVDGM